jgi:hypothetical protein
MGVAEEVGIREVETVGNADPIDAGAVIADGAAVGPLDAGGGAAQAVESTRSTAMMRVRDDGRDMY